jgi:cytochrome c-type biogenesis protein CcmE
MKKTHIVLLVLVVAAISFIASSFLDFSTYETFITAGKSPGKKIMVMGVFDKSQPMQYDPVKNPNMTVFYAKDKAGNVNKVEYTGEYIRDIDKSEQLVMTGYIDNGTFHCSKILPKCPSKYKKEFEAQQTAKRG